VAVYGFHSQAGWIAFNGAACGLAFLSRRSRWLNRTASAPTAADAGAAAAAATENPTAAYLMPLLAILFAGTLARAASSGFEWLYPLRLLCGAGVLWAYRRHWTTLNWRFSARGVAAGALIFLVWMFAAHQLLAPAGMPGTLATASPPLRAFWIACRACAAVLTVPLAEELAYRGYLMRRLSARDFDAVAFARVRWTALLASSLVFGLAHGTLWLPGTAAGLLYGAVLIRTGRMGEAVVAHATSNALIVAAVLVWHQWQLW
jgi:exosortase E/protease (VPEID-CTERM system)